MNVFIISEKIGYSGDRFRLGNEEYSSFQRRLVTQGERFRSGNERAFIISEKIGYSGERFRSGNEEHSSFQRRLGTQENVFDREIKGECLHHFREDWLLWENVIDREMKSIHHFREDWLLWRAFSIRK